MKHIKKIMCLLLTFVLVMGMGITAFAAPGDDDSNNQNNTTVNVVLPSGDKANLLENHKFVAYQIFTGTQGIDEEGKALNILGDIDWGTGINEEGFLLELTQKITAFAGIQYDENNTSDSAQRVANILSGLKDDTATLDEFARIAAKYTVVDFGKTLIEGSNSMPAGYYLILDETQVNDGEDKVINAALLQATTDVEIKVKTDQPTAEKKVGENQKANLENANVTVTAENGEGYNDVADYNIGDTVPFMFSSKLPDMEHYEKYEYIFHDKMDEGLVFSNNVVVKLGGKPVDTKYYNVVSPVEDGDTFDVVFEDLKGLATDLDAEAGDELRIEFTATLSGENIVIGKPGNVNEMYLEYTNKPDGSGKGKTPKDTVVVFTYKLDVTKVDGAAVGEDKKPVTLKDAEFKLKNSDGKWVKVDEKGKVTGWADSEEDGSLLKSDVNGQFNITGLDEGVYYLKETKAPTGYNILKDEVVIEIIAKTNNGQDVTDISNALEELNVKVGEGETAVTTPGDVDSGAVGVNIENNKGSELPETGGIGTTIFYVLGGILVIGCGVILVTRKRMSKED